MCDYKNEKKTHFKNNVNIKIKFLNAGIFPKQEKHGVNHGFIP